MRSRPMNANQVCLLVGACEIFVNFSHIYTDFLPKLL